MTSSSHRELGRVASSAFGWSFVNTAVGRLGTLAIGVLLARLLGPEAFGTFAVAMVALLAILSFNELGVSLAIVRWPEDPQRIVPTVTTVSVVTSTALFLGGYAVAPRYAAAMGTPDAAPVVRVMLLALVVNGLVASSAALLQREFRQKQRMIADQVNTWLGAVVSLALAFGGMGAMSLAVGRVAGSLVAAGILIAFAPQGLRFGLDREVLPRLLRFGLPLAGASAVVFAAGYADQLVVGSLLGPTSLGFYVLAFNLASWPVSIFSQPLRSVAPAVFARLQGDPAGMASTLVWVLGVLAAVTLPACLLLAGASAPIVQWVYGSAWAAAAPVLTFLGVVAALRILFELFYDYLVVLRRTGSVLVVQVVWLVTMVPATAAGALIAGVAGAAAGQLAATLVVVLPSYLLLMTRHDVRAADIMRRIALPTTAALGVGVVARSASIFVSSDWMAVALAATVCCATVLLLIAREEPLRATVRRELRRRRSRVVEVT